ncbi:AGE family epimerase/isomerase [Thalassobius sp. Cn5-15]|uniref:AGE family epimerase/isomerase n=1 Tax=Thalassobius sp. Cn5-15 TaxID=2917763 RepID=UPI001EF226BC|nr:AGE family epimerase/isomerase [Thalassobius sp. Cn5-15]MCG7495061.1 AGE family epimerase/isomerase [Thalassobius sp. Cn5-15]
MIRTTVALASEEHRSFLKSEALNQLQFFSAAQRADGGFFTLDHDGTPIPGAPQELHATTRMVHCFSLAKIAGWAQGEELMNHGFEYLTKHHRDPNNGGFFWSTANGEGANKNKLAYGHVFVLLAAASATAAGHRDGPQLLEEIDRVLDLHFWDEERGLFMEEWAHDWQPISTYRGMNANMHGLEALLSAYEATGRSKYLQRAGRIIDFFVRKIAPTENWRIPEHYDKNWEIDRDYAGNPMFRPQGTTPGHSFEFARLLLQYNEYSATPDPELNKSAHYLVQTALQDAWNTDSGGFVYTLNFDGSPAIRDRYWWPVTEAIGVLAAFLKNDPAGEYLEWYHRLWDAAGRLFIDHDRGGWFPEVDASGAVVSQQFVGKADLYHSLQAAMLPLTPSAANAYRDLSGVLSNHGGTAT